MGRRTIVGTSHPPPPTFSPPSTPHAGFYVGGGRKKTLTAPGGGLTTHLLSHRMSDGKSLAVWKEEEREKEKCDACCEDGRLKRRRSL